MKLSAVFLAGSVLAILNLLSFADVYLDERFLGLSLHKRWVQSKHRDDLGEFKLSAGKFFADEVESVGLQTSHDARFYAISAKLDKIIDNKEKNLVVQFSVKNEQNIDCGGGYIKLLPPDFDQDEFKGESLYNIMFGPDICGMKRKVHFILHHADENKEMKNEISAPIDQLTHLYTLIVSPDQSYKILVDNELEESGKLEESFDLLPSPEIEDPDAVKPADWVDEAKMPDPNDHKPADWVDGPVFIPDPDAEKPEIWDDDADGDWEAPQIPNPEYQGEWKPKMIDNPLYKGAWKVPLIPNPKYIKEPHLHAFHTAYVGFDLWQVKSGTIFDNILITDDIEYASKLANETLGKFREAERKAKEKLDDAEEEEEGDEAEKRDEENVVELPLDDTEKIDEIDEIKEESTSPSKTPPPTATTKEAEISSTPTTEATTTAKTQEDDDFEEWFSAYQKELEGKRDEL